MTGISQTYTQFLEVFLRLQRVFKDSEQETAKEYSRADDRESISVAQMNFK